MSDHIIVSGLEVFTRIGVPEKERSRKQRLRVTVKMKVETIKSAALTDEVTTTVDYAQVCERIKVTAAERPRKLIETLAEEIATMVLRNFNVREVTVGLQKFILPDTEYVGVEITRKKPKANLG